MLEVSGFHFSMYPKTIQKESEKKQVLELSKLDLIPIPSQTFFQNLAMFKFFSMSQEQSEEKNKHLELSK